MSPRAAKFWCKGYELQQVVDESRKSFRSFFRWLHSALLKVEEPSGTVEEIKVSQQEIKFIAEFLDNFDLDEDVEYDEEGNDVNKVNNASGTQFKRKLFCLSFGLILCTFRF